MLRNLLLSLLLFLAPRAWADSISSISGTIHEPGEKFTYSFVIQQFDEPTFVADVLNGTLFIHEGKFKGIGIYINDVYEFGYNESMVLLSFGNNPQWDLVATAAGVRFVDPPGVATPEPSSLVLLGCGLALLLRRTNLAASQ